MVKNLPANAGDVRSIPGPGRSHKLSSKEAHAAEPLKPELSNKGSPCEESSPVPTERQSPAQQRRPRAAKRKEENHPSATLRLSPHSAFETWLHDLLEKWKDHQSLSRVRLFTTPWTVARQAPLSMGFPRQEYWSGLPCMPFSGASSRPRDQTRVSHTAGRLFTI